MPRATRLSVEKVYYPCIADLPLNLLQISEIVNHFFFSAWTVILLALVVFLYFSYIMEAWGG